LNPGNKLWRARVDGSTRAKFERLSLDLFDISYSMVGVTDDGCVAFMTWDEWDSLDATENASDETTDPDEYGSVLRIWPGKQTVTTKVSRPRLSFNWDCVHFYSRKDGWLIMEESEVLFKDSYRYHPFELVGTALAPSTLSADESRGLNRLRLEFGIKTVFEIRSIRGHVGWGNLDGLATQPVCWNESFTRCWVPTKTARWEMQIVRPTASLLSRTAHSIAVSGMDPDFLSVLPQELRDLIQIFRQ
jgi:hypothetical protein